MRFGRTMLHFTFETLRAVNFAGSTCFVKAIPEHFVRVYSMLCSAAHGSNSVCVPWKIGRVIKLMFARCCTVCLKQCVRQGSVRRVSLSHEQLTLAQTGTVHTFSINVVRRSNTVRDLYRFDTFFVVVRFVSAVAEYYGPTCSWLYV